MPPSFFRHLKQKFAPEDSAAPSGSGSHGSRSAAPPEWTPAPEISHKYGKYNEAPEDEFVDAERFCEEYPLEPPKLLPSDLIDRIRSIGCKAWGLEVPTTPRFSGHVRNESKSEAGLVNVHTTQECKDVCLLSDLPIISGLYDIKGKTGIYYEVVISRMEGIIAVGTACRPYPSWRLPGWNRMSSGFHLDDFRKFFEDSDGGRSYTDAINQIQPGDTIGCGYEFETGSIFYTYNGLRLPTAFQGVYLPRRNQDVYAAIGVEGHCDFQVNFGGDLFKWKEGNEWAWRVEGHVGQMVGAYSNVDEELPAYQ